MADPKSENPPDYSPERYASVYNDYKAALRLPKKIDCPQASNDFMNSRNPDFYKSIKIGGQDVSTRLSRSGNQSLATLENAFKTEQVMDNAVSQFHEDITALNKVLAKNPPMVEVQAVLTYLTKNKNTFLTAMEAQQQKERDAIESLFNQTNIDNTKTALGISDAQVNTVKAQFIDALTKEHEAQRKAFLDPFNKAENQLHADLQKDSHRVNALAAFSAKQKEMEEELEKKVQAAEALQQQNQPTTISTKRHNNKSQLRGIDPKDLENLKTYKGRKIQPLGENGFLLQLPSREGSVWNLWNCFYTRNAVTSDLRSLTQLIRSQGHETIQLTLEYNDEEQAKEVAKLAFIEARKTGFEADKITIKIIVNGKEQTLNPDQLGLTKEENDDIASNLNLNKETYQQFKSQQASQESMQALNKEINEVKQPGN